MAVLSATFLRTAGRVSVAAVQLMAAVHMFTTHIADARITVGSSMVPTMSPSGEMVVCVKFPVYSVLYHMREVLGRNVDPNALARHAYDCKTRNTLHLELGDLVVAISPTNPARAVCKRVLGLPGDTLQSDPRDDKSPTITVPRGHVWLAGDNVNNSTDSRHYGPVPMGLLRGRVVARLLPLERFGTILQTIPIPATS